jgi:DNA transposition AAA+ family ATPase
MLGEAIERSLSRRPGSGRLVVINGAAGTGKTSSAKAIAKQYHGVYFSVPEMVTGRALISGVLDSMVGWRVELHRVEALWERLLIELERRGWPPIFFDEADRLNRTIHSCHLIEIVRDLHDEAECKSPIVLLSIGKLARHLTNATGYAAAVSTRVCASVHFEAGSLKDAKLLARELLEGVTLTDDLIADCMAQSGGSFRPLLGLYSEIEQVCRAAEIETVSLAAWEQLSTYAAPSAAPSRVSKRNSGTAERRKVA